MKNSSIKATDAATWNSGWSGHNKPSQSSYPGGEPVLPQAEQRTKRDVVSFSELIETSERERQGQGGEEQQTGDQQLKQLMDLVDRSNETIRLMAEALKPMRVETKAVPSALGLSVNSAAAKLKMASLKVRGVSQEYSNNVPAGHVISQVPGPGSLAAKKAGVKLIISKGKPPEKEKYDTIRRKENVPQLKMRSKYDSGGDEDEGTTIGTPGEPGTVTLPSIGDGEITV